MEWNVPFVIYRVTDDGKLQEVFHASDLKAAKYWLTYIAEQGDVLCKTPLHPKHSRKGSEPEYWSHKADSRDPISNEEDWKVRAQERQFQGTFPSEQLCSPEAK
jgi:hypothetical protein